MDPLGDPDLLAAAERAGFAVGPPPSDDPWADSPGSLQPDRVEDLAAPVLQVPDLRTAAAAAAVDRRWPVVAHRRLSTAAVPVPTSHRRARPRGSTPAAAARTGM